MLNIVNEFLASYKGQELLKTIDNEYQNYTVYPKKDDLFKAFKLCLNPKVVIIGQDPYHDGSADGLAFSSQVKMPPSLKNIFKEILTNYPNEKVLLSSDLSYLAEQGVLLMNASLSVKAKQPNSHKDIWQEFFAFMMSALNERFNNLVFMLWGNFAKKYEYLIDANKHLILTAAHPSPLARGEFFGNGHFLKCNEYLKAIGKKEINWI